MLAPVEEKIRLFLNMILSSIDLEYTLEFLHEGEQWRVVVNLQNQDNAILVGEQGETLSALQHIIRTLVHKHLPEDKTHFIIDIAGYRKQREDILFEKIPDAVQNSVLAQGSTLVVVGLSSYERLLVHKILTDITGIQSMSVGGSTNRKLVVMPTTEVGSKGLEKAVIMDFSKLEVA